MNVPSVFSRYRDALDAEMRAIVGSDGALLYRMVRYHLGWEEADCSPGPGAGGKALRPVLCLLACEGTRPHTANPSLTWREGGGRSVEEGRQPVSLPLPFRSAGPPLRTPRRVRSAGPPLEGLPLDPHRGRTPRRAWDGGLGGEGASPALPAAAAIELIHNFSLVHDDIQDQDTERHHRPTAWAVWGVPQAINAGDGLWALATRAFLRAAERGVPAEIVVRAHGMLNDACLTMIEGQSLDLAFEQQSGEGGVPVVSADQYLDMIGRKTGALIATALAIGALIGSGDAAVAAGFHRFGVELGRVFQIQDDMLGIWGQEQLTGKSTSSDIRRRKQSYPVVYTLSQGPTSARAALAYVYALPEIDDAAVLRAVRAMEAAGARDHAAGLTAAAHDRALDILDTLPLDSAARAALREIADFLLWREF
jgi:geranylgeranyl diphosphate synthase type I